MDEINIYIGLLNNTWADLIHTVLVTDEESSEVLEKLQEAGELMNEILNNHSMDETEG